MPSFDRRTFIGASLLTAASAPWSSAAPVPTVKPTEDFPFQPATLFLTWQRDPTTTMTIQWIGSVGETADDSIYLRTASPIMLPSLAIIGGPAAVYSPYRWTEFKTATKPYPKTELKIFHVELTGLRPGTDYEFRIGKLSPTYRFRTMPAKATDTIQFVSGGDCGVNAHAIANNISAANQDPMFAIIGGDLGYDNGRSAEVSLAFIRNYSKHMVGRNGRLIPLIPCIGNHEVDGGYGKSREKAPFFYALFGGLFDETGYTALDFGDYLSLVLLDTGHTSAIGGDQTGWLEKTLKARKDHPHVMVVNHVPAYPSARKIDSAAGAGTGTGADNRKHWVPLFERYRVSVVLEHHDHTFKRSKPLIGGLMHEDGILYLGDGSWGRLRALQPAEKLSYLAVANTEYHLTVHRIQGDQRYHLALDENGRVMDACHTSQRRSGVVTTRG